jgi:hypothetical protein
MAAPEFLWSLYNRKSDVQIDSLKLSQAKAIFSGLAESKKKEPSRELSLKNILY